MTSSFGGRGKRTAWSAWKDFEDSTPALCILADKPSIEDVMNVLPTIERLVIIMYDRSSCESSINYERQVLFTQKGREIENIPPTRDALAQHLLRVGYIAGHIWQQSTTKAPVLPSPADFGWSWDNGK